MAREHLHFFYNDGSGVLVCRCGETKDVGREEASRMMRARRLDALGRALDRIKEGAR